MTADNITALTFDEAVERRQTAVAVRDAAQAEVDSLTPILATTLIVENTKSRRACNEQWNVTLVDTKRETLSKEKLLEAGVTMAQIKAATTESKSTSIRVTRVNGK